MREKNNDCYNHQISQEISFRLLILLYTTSLKKIEHNQN